MENASSKSVCCLITTERSPKYNRRNSRSVSQGFCGASRDNTEGTQGIQGGNRKKSSFKKEELEEAEREDLQRKPAAELSFRL